MKHLPSLRLALALKDHVTDVGSLPTGPPFFHAMSSRRLLRIEGVRADLAPDLLFNVRRFQAQLAAPRDPVGPTENSHTRVLLGP